MKDFIAIGECMIELSAAAGDAGGGADLWRMGVAGDTLNTAWYARAGLGPDWRVRYGTRLGTDRFSDRITAFLAANDIDTGLIARDAAHGPGLYAITLDPAGERSFTYWRGQSAARGLADDPSALAAMMAGAGAVHVSGITLAILPPAGRAALVAALAAARAAGALTVLDPNIRPRLWEDVATARSAIMQAAGACALILPSLDDEQAAFGDADADATATRYLAAGAGEVVVKAGGAPVRVATAEQRQWVGDLPRVTPTDTTGAGDSFNGAYLAARLQGAGAADAVRAGHAQAMAVVRHPGALIPMTQLRQGR